MKANTALLRYLRLQQQRDATKFKRDLFHFKIEQSLLLRWLYRVVHKSKILLFFAALGLFLERFFRLKILSCTPQAIAAPLMATENQSLFKLFPSPRLAQTQYGWLTPLQKVKIKKFILLLWRICNKFETYQTLRLAQFLGAYIHLHEVFKKNPAPAHIITSDANPNSLALLALAARNQARVIFVSHGEVVPPVARFPADMAFLLTKHSALAYQRAGNQWPKIIIQGQKNIWRKVRSLSDTSEIKLGFICGKFIEVNRIKEICADLRRNFKIQSFHLRPHPAFKCNQQTQDELRILGISYDSSHSLAEFCQKCDLLVIGNSTAIAECLLHGFPVLYFSDRAQVDEDRYGFVDIGLVLKFDGHLDIAKINHFYASTDFSNALANYWNLEESYESSRKNFLDTLSELSAH